MPKRDLERIREIVLIAVDMPFLHDDGLVDFTEQMRPADAYQLYLMTDAGLIEGKGSKEGFFFITSAGQDFYDAIHSQSIWNETMKLVSEVGGNATLEIAMQLAKGLVKTQIEKHTGITLR